MSKSKKEAFYYSALSKSTLYIIFIYVDMLWRHQIFYIVLLIMSNVMSKSKKEAFYYSAP